MCGCGLKSAFSTLLVPPWCPGAKFKFRRLKKISACCGLSPSFTSVDSPNPIPRQIQQTIHLLPTLYTSSYINLIVKLIRRSILPLSLNNYPEFQVSFSRFQQSAYVIKITFWQFPIKNHYNFLTLNIHDN